jgi:glycerophosphoryl diester phosphodiesterase
MLGPIAQNFRGYDSMTSISSRRAEIVAHRGASGYAPETTLEAYRLALAMDADYVEMDIHMLRDGTLVAIHDPEVDRTTNGKGKISELTLAELKALDAGSWFNHAHPEKACPEYIGLKVPTVQEVLDLIKDSAAGCYIEIKDPERYPPNLEAELLTLVYKNGLEKRTRILSFHAPSIGKVKALDASIPTALLISRHSKNPVEDTFRVTADELAIRHGLATARIVNAAHEKGLSLAVWTVDREQEMKRMMRIGADRIITNYPDRLRRLVEG